MENANCVAAENYDIFVEWTITHVLLTWRRVNTKTRFSFSLFCFLIKLYQNCLCFCSYWSPFAYLCVIRLCSGIPLWNGIRCVQEGAMSPPRPNVCQGSSFFSVCCLCSRLKYWYSSRRLERHQEVRLVCKLAHHSEQFVSGWSDFHYFQSWRCDNFMH
jgi:hypothetical protein